MGIIMSLATLSDLLSRRSSSVSRCQMAFLCITSSHIMLQFILQFMRQSPMVMVWQPTVITSIMVTDTITLTATAMITAMDLLTITPTVTVTTMPTPLTVTHGCSLRLTADQRTVQIMIKPSAIGTTTLNTANAKSVLTAEFGAY